MVFHVDELLYLGLCFVLSVLIFWFRPGVGYVLAMDIWVEAASDALNNAGNDRTYHKRPAEEFTGLARFFVQSSGAKIPHCEPNQ